MFFAVTILMLILGLSLSWAVVRRFGRSRGFWGELFLKCVAADKVSAWSRLFTVFGALMVIGSGLAAVERGLFVLAAERTTGTIERLIESSSKEGKPSYAPEFSFVDGKGRKHATQSHIYGPLDEYKIGGQVPVLYSRIWYGRSVIDDYGQIWGLASALAIFGSILLSAGSVRLYWPEIVSAIWNFRLRGNGLLVAVHTRDRSWCGRRFIAGDDGFGWCRTHFSRWAFVPQQLGPSSHGFDDPSVILEQLRRQVLAVRADHVDRPSDCSSVLSLL
ncbi:MAG: hypothetical protein K0Q55_1728 [Verrucomicrobia bacterium]|nr:hypothetical protein [Verrucomicrobiota bacterium]